MKFPSPSSFSVPALMAILALPCLVALSCHIPVDAVSYGQLCFPATDDCPSSVEFERPQVGRNALELTLHTNASDSTLQLQVTTDQNLSLPSSRELTEDGRTILISRDYPTGEGEELHDRLTSYDLTVASPLRLALYCVQGKCDHRLDYLHLLEPLECVESADCSRGQFCEYVYGRCAECSDDSQCATDQICDRETGMCFPGDQGGCSTLSAGGPVPILVLLAIFLFVARRPLGRALWPMKKLMLYLLLVTSLAGVPQISDASTSASLSAGGGIRVLTGDPGQVTGLGWGITVAQQLRWHRLGTHFRLSTHFFPLRDHPGAAQGPLSGYAVSIGPQFFLPLPLTIPGLRGDAPFEFAFALDYTRFGISDNRLATITGLGLSYHSLGPSVGLDWRWASTHLRLHASYGHIFGWPGGVFSLNFLAGLGH